MKKILIVTLYGNNNFGNKLQNYALQETLKKYGYIVETARIKYRSNNHLLNLKVYIYGLLKSFILSKKKKDREKKFCEFNKLFIKYKKKWLYSNSIIDLDYEYNIVVYGSDQIWNPSCYGNSKLFLGYFATNNIAYAASFGIDSLPQSLIEDYKKGLYNFKDIAVREKSAFNIVNSLINKKVNVVVDPTMLLVENEWLKIIKKPAIFNEKKYIFNYFLGNLTDERYKIIQNFAKENNCKIINIMDKNSPYYDCGPSEFLYLEKNAYLICTDSFHSCVFGIIFNTPFLVFDRDDEKIEKMNTRIDNLLDIFNLKNNKFQGKIDYESISYNKEKINKMINIEKEKAIEFLKNSIMNCEDDINE